MSAPGTHLSFPAHIIRGRGALSQLSAHLDKYGRHAFVIGGKNALAATLPLLKQQFADIHDLSQAHLVETAWYGGEVTQKNIADLVSAIQQHDADVVLAIGGGKALDAGKAAAEIAGVPVVTIPTIAATCSAVSAVSVLYDEQGHYQELLKLKNAPDLVILDPALIANAPVRWLSAGLGDTLAKLYEYRIISGGAPDYSLNMAAYIQGLLCYQIIERFGKTASAEVESGRAGVALEQVMDAIFIYAGFTSIMGVGDHVAAAHALFDGFTVLDKTRDFGHGLLVGFGNLCLLALEKRSDAEIAEAIALAKDCGVPVSLREIAPLSEAELLQVVESAINTPDMANMPFKVTSEMLLQAISRVNQLAA